ncbi:hypothetical protein ES689_08145 [Frigoribacterium sp. ACAM 257]|uniref:hypothetical protein n=1 Tax=Frigoribacterium sp. ACAM 257 TaxID=2508998 RepID=UPI0011B9F7ED|nr:hypothetical protein [Frigoribacterium sp. ACAM 257]TWX38586.1 hypothetical protein ES689_08145 [Frigoribacterium sp. ACAM 257]
MTRPLDWSALDLASDPAPGHPDDIRAAATDARGTAQLIESQVRDLRRLGTAEGWDADSGRTFATEAPVLADAIARAQARYEGLGTTLDNYATGLEGLQRRADAALADAEAAAAAGRRAQALTVDAVPGTLEEADQAEARQRAIAASSDDRDAALAVVRQLVGHGGGGGELAALDDALVVALAAAGDDDLKDSWLDPAKQFVHDNRGVINVVKDVLRALGPLLTVAAIFVPIAAVPALLAVGLALAAVTLLLTLAQAVAGDATVGDVLADLVDVGMAVVGLGGARAVASAVSATRTSVVASRSMAAARRAVAGKVPARKAAAVFHRARLAEAARVTRQADAIAASLRTRVLDGLVTGGASELSQLRRLAVGSGGPLAAQVWRPGIAWAATVGPYGAVDFVRSGGETIGHLRDYRSGTYWDKKTLIHIGSV